MRMAAPLEVGICCRNLEQLLVFYTDVLGLTLVNTVEVPAEKAAEAHLSDGAYRVARLQTDRGERIKLLQPAAPPAELQPASRILDRANTAYLTFIVPDLRSTLARLLEAGMAIDTGAEPVEVRDGTWLVFGRDPEGNVLEFVEYRDVADYRPDLKERP